MSAAAWLHTARRGYCTTTVATNDCEGDKGSFELSLCETSSWSLAVDACLKHCRSCAQCAFVSISIKHHDCSWFSKAIDCTDLKHDVEGFRSGPLVSRDSRHSEDVQPDSLLCQLVKSPGLFNDSVQPCPYRPIVRQPPAAADDSSVSSASSASSARSANGGKVAFITVMLGLYERTLKEPVVQLGLATTPRFIAFCDATFAAHTLRRPREELLAAATTTAQLNGSVWRLDWTPHHLQHAANASAAHGTNFGLGKWYKMQWYRIPRLRSYRWVVWMDGTVELLGARCASFIAGGAHSLIGLHFPPRRCSVRSELAPTLTGGKYHGQPVLEQMRRYALDGQPEAFGMWLTTILVFDAAHPLTRRFVDAWYDEVNAWSSQDQLSFPYLAWKYRDVLPVSSFVPERLNAIRGDSLGCYYGFPCAFDKRWHGEGSHQDIRDCRGLHNDLY